MFESLQEIFRPILGPTHLPLQWAPGVLSTVMNPDLPIRIRHYLIIAVKGPGCETDH